MFADDAKEEDEELLKALAASMEGMKDANVDALKESSESNVEEQETHVAKKPVYPPLPEEPKGDRNLLCRVGIRLPDGRRLQRNFLRSDSIQVELPPNPLHAKNLFLIHRGRNIGLSGLVLIPSIQSVRIQMSL